MIELKCVKARNDMLVEGVVALLKERRLHQKEDSLQRTIPLLLASFNEEIVEMLHAKTNLSLIQLIDRKQAYNLDKIRKVGWAIGITADHLVETNYKLVEDCHGRGLKVMYWTLANDTDKLPAGFSHIDELYEKLIAVGMDGLITEFPDYTEALVRSSVKKHRDQQSETP